MALEGDVVLSSSLLKFPQRKTPTFTNGTSNDGYFCCTAWNSRRRILIPALLNAPRFYGFKAANCKLVSNYYYFLIWQIVELQTKWASVAQW